MIVSSRLLADLKRQLKLLEADLTRQSDEGAVEWTRALRAEFDEASARRRTALTWSAWREGELTQAAVAWILATTFVRFGEDNGLLAGLRDNVGRSVSQPWVAGQGARLGRAVENQTAYYSEHPTANVRDWLQEAFGVLADLPAGSALVDRRHNPVWRVLISADAAKSFVDFWRATNSDGGLTHDFTDAELDTRFLGDLYQDLSEYAKKTFALLQTPVFVEEFILDRTLTPAIAEFGIDGLKLIDPTCGSGHFLLGAFARLDAEWRALAPALDARSRVQKALDSIYGVDLNPFAVAIARFRLTVAALKASGENSLVGAPAFGYHLAVGDSLLRSAATSVQLDIDDGQDDYVYAAEDVREYHGILETNQYHVVVGNPPYITVKDRALSSRYRALYPTCHRQYALSVPFMELFFKLAKRDDSGAGSGYVGQITSNSFMKREFGTKLIEHFLSGVDLVNPVDLTEVIDTSGAYIPGHGTPTVILVGRRRRPSSGTVRAVLGIRGEPGQPAEAARGLVWAEIVSQLRNPGYTGEFISVTDLPREVLAKHPWSLTGGGASELLERLNAEPRRLLQRGIVIGRTTHTGLDDAFYRNQDYGKRRSIAETTPVVLGDQVREYQIKTDTITLFPYNTAGEACLPGNEFLRDLWPLRTSLRRRVDFGHSPEERGLKWYDHSMFFADRYRTKMSIAFAFVATHNHFVLDRGGKVFNRSAPVIQLPADASEEDYFELLGILNSSTACFWLKQVSHNKGSTVDSKGARQTQVPWEDFYEFTGTKLQEFPLPSSLPGKRGQDMDHLANAVADSEPGRTLDAAVASGGFDAPSLLVALEISRRKWSLARNLMVFHQEELDWETYRSFGLVEEDLTDGGSEPIELNLGERAFEITMARNITGDGEIPAWFERHGSVPMTELPASWPTAYRELVEKRLNVIATNPQINLLERPENKRRWANSTWESQLQIALRELVLDRLEAPQLWCDLYGPITKSVAQLADTLRNDEVIHAALASLAGSTDVDAVASLAALLAEEAVPYLGSLRYRHTGLAKFGEWQQVWDLQRAEDAGARVTIPVPPKYAPGDFAKNSYWRARGKLDVSKERFISYPGTSREGDTSPVLGWAGWNHAEQGLALSRLVGDQAALGAGEDELTPLLAGLMELEPWLNQWHSDVDPTRGTSPAAAITGLLDQQLTRLGMTRAQAAKWRPVASTKGRRKPASASGAGERQE